MKELILTALDQSHVAHASLPSKLKPPPLACTRPRVGVQRSVVVHQPLYEAHTQHDPTAAMPSWGPRAPLAPLACHERRWSSPMDRAQSAICHPLLWPGTSLKPAACVDGHGHSWTLSRAGKVFAVNRGAPGAWQTSSKFQTLTTTCSERFIAGLHRGFGAGQSSDWSRPAGLQRRQHRRQASESHTCQWYHSFRSTRALVVIGHIQGTDHQEVHRAEEKERARMWRKETHGAIQ